MAEIGLGTAAIGRPIYINIKETVGSKPFDIEQFRDGGMQLLDSAYAKGVRRFDTAPGYGLAENLVMDWIQQREITDVSVSSKWGYTYVANFSATATLHEVKEHSLAKLHEQWNTTKELRPSLDIYQIHSATLDTGVLKNKEVLTRLYELKKTHGIEIGLSTTGANQAEVMRVAVGVEVAGEALFDSFQVTYNVFDQSIAEVLNQDFDGKLIIKEALANGRVFPNEGKYSDYKAHYVLLDKLSKKYKVGIDAIALRFCMDSISSHTVLSGASTEKQLAENLKAYDFELTKEELRGLRALKVNPDSYWAERKALEWN